MAKKVTVAFKCDEVNNCGCGTVFPIEISGVPILRGRILKAAKAFQKPGQPIELAFLKLALYVDGIMNNVDFQNVEEDGRKHSK